MRFPGVMLPDKTVGYSPALGVFSSLDTVENGNRYLYVNGNPINDAVGEPMSLNRYSYVAGNPTNFVDPSGMIMENPAIWEPCANENRYDPPPRQCPRMPSGVVYRWEESLLKIAALSEIKGGESWVDEGSFQTLAYAIAWMILNRITSPCRTGALTSITRIHQAAFSGNAIRNLGVYGPALSVTPMAQYLEPNRLYPEAQAVYNYLNISEEAVQEYVGYVIGTRIPSTAGLTNAPDEDRGLKKVSEPVTHALDEWCSGQNGPGVAPNILFYATAQNRDPETGSALYDNPMTEIYNQLAYLELLHDGESCGCKFGWAGLNAEQASVRLVLACENTVEVPITVKYSDNPNVYTMRRERGKELAPQCQVTYP